MSAMANEQDSDGVMYTCDVEALKATMKKAVGGEPDSIALGDSHVVFTMSEGQLWVAFTHSSVETIRLYGVEDDEALQVLLSNGATGETAHALIAYATLSSLLQASAGPLN